MRFKIAPVPLSVVRTCEWIEFQCAEISQEKIVMNVQFFDSNRQLIIEGPIQLKDVELLKWNHNELDLVQWLLDQFKIDYTLDQPLPSLKRKDFLEAQDKNKKQKII